MTLPSDLSSKYRVYEVEPINTTRGYLTPPASEPSPDAHRRSLRSSQANNSSIIMPAIRVMKKSAAVSKMTKRAPQQPSGASQLPSRRSPSVDRPFDHRGALSSAGKLPSVQGRKHALQASLVPDSFNDLDDTYAIPDSPIKSKKRRRYEPKPDWTHNTVISHLDSMVPSNKRKSARQRGRAPQEPISEVPVQSAKKAKLFWSDTSPIKKAEPAAQPIQTDEPSPLKTPQKGPSRVADPSTPHQRTTSPSVLDEEKVGPPAIRQSLQSTPPDCVDAIDLARDHTGEDPTSAARGETLHQNFDDQEHYQSTSCNHEAPEPDIFHSSEDSHEHEFDRQSDCGIDLLSYEELQSPVQQDHTSIESQYYSDRVDETPPPLVLESKCEPAIECKISAVATIISDTPEDLPPTELQPVVSKAPTLIPPTTVSRLYIVQTLEPHESVLLESLHANPPSDIAKVNAATSHASVLQHVESSSAVPTKANTNGLSADTAAAKYTNKAAGPLPQPAVFDSREGPRRTGIDTAADKRQIERFGKESATTMISKRRGSNSEPDGSDSSDSSEDDSSSETTLVEDETMSHRKWLDSLKRHQKSTFEELQDICHILTRGLVDNETAIEQLCHDFQNDGTKLIRSMQDEQALSVVQYSNTIKQCTTSVLNCLSSAAEQLSNNARGMRSTQHSIEREAAAINIDSTGHAHTKLLSMANGSL